jgi:G3E family GTPase
VVVTGFLGAGKTTLIRRFLGKPEGANTAVIVNEFGAVGIDDALVRASADETVLLGNGCLCCTTRSDLEQALRNLIADRDRGALPRFQRVIIETSGLADPGPILQTFVTDRSLGGEFHVEAVITVADATNGPETLKWSAEARKQVILADRLIVSKADLEEDRGAALMNVLLRLNPRARIVTAEEGHIAPHVLTEPPEYESGPPFVAEASHSDGITSFVVCDDGAMAWPALEQTLAALIALRGSDLLRVKGFVKILGTRGPVLVQCVQHLAYPPIELLRWPDGVTGTQLVFITRHIPETAIRALLSATRAVAEEIPLPSSN